MRKEGNRIRRDVEWQRGRATTGAENGIERAVTRSPSLVPLRWADANTRYCGESSLFALHLVAMHVCKASPPHLGSDHSARMKQQSRRRGSAPLDVVSRPDR